MADILRSCDAIEQLSLTFLRACVNRKIFDRTGLLGRYLAEMRLDGSVLTTLDSKCR
jgi:hypothetical protein